MWWFEPAAVPVGPGVQGPSAGGAHMSAPTPVRPVVLGSGEQTSMVVSVRSTSQEVSRSPSDLEAAVGKSEGNGVVA